MGSLCGNCDKRDTDTDVRRPKVRESWGIHHRSLSWGMFCRKMSPFVIIWVHCFTEVGLGVQLAAAWFNLSPLSKWRGAQTECIDLAGVQDGRALYCRWKCVSSTFIWSYCGVRKCDVVWPLTPLWTVQELLYIYHSNINILCIFFFSCLKRRVTFVYVWFVLLESWGL